MKSETPKVLIEANGRPLIAHLLKNIAPVAPRPTIVVGYRGEEVIGRLEGRNDNDYDNQNVRGTRYDYVWQKEQLGTGHAVACAKESLQNKGVKNVVVLYGDHALVTAETVNGLVEARESNDATIAMGAITVPSFEGDNSAFERFGRIIRDELGNVVENVEFKDATSEQRAMCEVNPSYFCFEANWLWENIEKIQNKNAAREYYLTDLVKLAFSQRKKVVTVPIDPVEGMGANTPEELSIVNKYLQ